ncbi:MAG: isopentenyl-diphosphate Delta-isomerase [Ichthyobacteriaceae bacterium]|nr:isopentenyl-diphosphate Delta-isomerase [Ichthyobacteriaceae bacterium]
MLVEKVVLVNTNDEQIGVMEKMEAHEKALLHRAFSVFVINSKNQLMIQRRALGKYHSPGLWTNTCCSHPRENESYANGAHRRLVEEMGFDCNLNEVFSFIYKAPFDNGLTEHEFDRVFVGTCETQPVINTDEVDSWKWIDMPELVDDIKNNSDNYTVWFKIIFEKFSDYFTEYLKK